RRSEVFGHVGPDPMDEGQFCLAERLRVAIRIVNGGRNVAVRPPGRLVVAIDVEREGSRGLPKAAEEGGLADGGEELAGGRHGQAAGWRPDSRQLVELAIDKVGLVRALLYNRVAREVGQLPPLDDHRPAPTRHELEVVDPRGAKHLPIGDCQQTAIFQRLGAEGASSCPRRFRSAGHLGSFRMTIGVTPRFRETWSRSGRRRWQQLHGAAVLCCLRVTPYLPPELSQSVYY